MTIECVKLTKKYPGTTSKSLDNVSVSIPTKGIFSLIGRNGAGKTTLTRILGTQLMPSSGYASINGLDIIDDAKELREIIAVIPQDGRPVPWVTPAQMIMTYLMWRGYGIGEAKSRALSVIKDVGIYKEKDMHIGKLSGGTKRKVLVGCVLASEAKIVFMDEPTTGLDLISRTSFWETLGKLKKDRFFLLTTHYLEEAESLADGVGILDKGKLLVSGSMDQSSARFIGLMLRYPVALCIISAPYVIGERYARYW